MRNNGVDLTNRLNNAENTIAMYEHEQRERAQMLMMQYSKRAIEGCIPVRIDRKTVIFKRILQ